VPVDPARLLVCELIDGAFGRVSGPIRPDWNAADGTGKHLLVMSLSGSDPIPDMNRIEILQRSSLVPVSCAILSVGSTGGDRHRPNRFKTIQIRPKDVLTCPWQ
jgi:hypothetical protein